MTKFLIIPSLDHIEESSRLAEEYGLGYEYNDFFLPDVLDDASRIETIAERYRNSRLPSYTTMHGAFFDVIVFSPDSRIKEISMLRVEQSIKAARRIGAKAVVFHTNYNPFLNSEAYVKTWIKQNTEYWSDLISNNPDLNIYLENMFDTDPMIMSELAANLSHLTNFGVCLDYAHLAITKVPAKEWMTSLGKYVKHMHINDNDLISDLHHAVGDGKIDWNEFYRLYDDNISKDTTILIETNSLQNQIRSIEKLKKDGFIK